jgi:hypothetical protein
LEFNPYGSMSIWNFNLRRRILPRIILFAGWPYTLK